MSRHSNSGSVVNSGIYCNCPRSQPLLAHYKRGSSMAEQPCLWAVCLVRIQALGKTDVI